MAYANDKYKYSIDFKNCPQTLNCPIHGQEMTDKIDISDNDGHFPTIRKTSNFVFWNRTRIFIMFLSLICMTLTQINSLTFTFTVICMDDVIEEHHRTNQSGLHFMESSTQKGFLFSGIAIGATIGLLPAAPLISRFGIRKVLTLSGICSSLGALLFPIAVDSNLYFVFICRILQGLGSSVIYTAVAVIPGIWSPRSEMGTFMAVLSCALQISNVICMSISGILCESSLGWRSINYIFGALTLGFYAAFFFTYKDSPTVHRNVSQKELSRIQDGKAEVKKRESVPFKNIIFDKTVMTCVISALGGNLGFFMLVLYGPTYLKDVLHFDVRGTGFASALPHLLSAICKVVAAQISDRLTFVSEKTRFVFFASISQFGMAVAFAILAWTSSRLVAQIAYTFAIVLSGINVMGVIKCLQLRCRQHVHFGMTFVSLTANLIQLIGPIFVGIFVPDNSAQQFAVLFYAICVITVITNIPFPFITTSEPAPFVTPKTLP